MKQFNYSGVISSFIIGVSIVIASLILQNSSGNKSIVESNLIDSVRYDKPLLSLKEAAEFLGLSEYKLKTIISSEANILKQTGSYVGTMFPYMNVENEIYVSRAGLTAWIEEATLQKKKY